MEMTLDAPDTIWEKGTRQKVLADSFAARRYAFQISVSRSG